MSYGRENLGRLASLPIGDELVLTDGSILEVVEKETYRPSPDSTGWDSLNTVIEGNDFGPITVKSLRALLNKLADEVTSEDLVARMLAEAEAEGNVIEGKRRTIIAKMGLRDQPILDKFQDEIFRLPLDKRLLVLGPPGTGKTTTLIRRLGQKLDTAYLEDREQQLVQDLAQAQGITHADNWLMFTPTDLLKQYLKEAFAREGVPAPDQRIKTWKDYRRDLARNTFGVLRTSSGSGYILKDELPSLRDDALTEPLRWFESFNAVLRSAYTQSLDEAATQLIESELPEAAELGERLRAVLALNEGNLGALFSALAKDIPNVKTLRDDLKADTDKKIRGALNLQLNSDRNFIKELASHIDSLQQSQASDHEDQDDQDAEDEEDSAAPATPAVKAISDFNSAVKAQARTAAGRRAPSKTSKTGKIIEWLGERSLPDDERAIVGKSLLIQTAASRFLNPVKRYIDDIPKRYRSYRREQQLAGQWYQHEGFDSRDIHPLELDVVLLAILRASGELLAKADVQRNLDELAWSSLQSVMRLYRNQILVDEATDFSPIQLACMAALAHPRLRSFFACGDFNQRLTTWGARSFDELKWVYPDFDFKPVNVIYRQTRQLNDLARAIIDTLGGTQQEAQLPQHLDSDGFSPALLEQATDDQTTAWLADRIRDIVQFYSSKGGFPSTAVFVNSEAQVGPLAEALSKRLEENNILAVACHDGKVVGQENDVRIFHVEHIKGLEFEAVFFVGLDQLAQQQETLFDKYLYVGTTRAATFLGATCERNLPTAIENLRPHFCTDWSSSVGD